MENKINKIVKTMSEKEQEILFNALKSNGWVKLKVRDYRVVEGYKENKL